MVRAWPKFALAAGSTALFLGFAELLARAFVEPAEIQSRSLFEYEPKKTYRLKPNFTGSFAGRRVRTNSYGHRDDEIPIEKPENEQRVLVLGDSIAFGHGVRFRESFPEALERKLDLQHPEFDVAVVNTAAPGNSPIQEFYDLESGIRFEPDVVVLQFSLNDVVEPFWFLKRLGGTGLDYHAVPDLPRLHYELLDDSALYSTLYRLLGQVLMMQVGSDEQLRTEAVRREEYAVKKLVTQPDDPKIEDAWDRCLRDLERILELADRHDLPVVLLVSPFGFQLPLGRSAAHPQRRLFELAQTRHVNYVDILALLKRRFVHWVEPDAPETDHTVVDEIVARYRDSDPQVLARFWGTYFLDPSHPNPAGHELLAEQLVEVVEGALRGDPPTYRPAGSPEDRPEF